MLVEIDHVNNGPRMDGGPKPFDPNAAVTIITYYKDSETYLIEIADQKNPEFRARLVISSEELTAAKERGQ